MRNSIPALLLGSALLTACAAGGAQLPPVQPTDPLARTPTEQYPIELVDRSDEILLASTGALSPNQAAALGALAMRWSDDGGASPITIHAAPAGPAHGTASAAAEALAGYGVPSAAIRIAPAAGGEVPTAPVRVAFARLEAVLPDCASKWGELTRTRSNEVHAGFGCSIASNMAAQTANPRDLVRPRGETPADGERRADVIDKYRKGTSTASQRGSDERGVVSGAIQ